MTFVPEECYVATVLVNLMNKEDIVPWNHRFIRWKHENGNRSANLGCEHFHYLLEDEYLFARKIELPCSTVLLDRIDRYLLQDKDIRLMPTGGWRYDGFLKYGHYKKFCDFVTQMWWDIGARTGIDMGAVPVITYRNGEAADLRLPDMTRIPTLRICRACSCPKGMLSAKWQTSRKNWTSLPPLTSRYARTCSRISRRNRYPRP